MDKQFKFREAELKDIPEMKLIRDNVKENALVSLKIEFADYEQPLFKDGKGWVCLSEDKVIGFACGRIKQKDVWALFVSSEYESMGVGNRLMQILEAWMFDKGCERLSLSTEPGTRAERLYLRRGWQKQGLTATGEVLFVYSKEDYLKGLR